MYIDRSLREYLNDLAARKPAPGGGSAAAVGASMGAALVSMVANYTIGNLKYKDEAKKAAEILANAERLRGELEILIDKDIEAYDKLSKEMKTAGGDSARRDILYKEAASAPFEICKIAAECLGLCDELVDCGNKNLITDTAIAAIMLEGAFFSAKFNVYINLKYVSDVAYIGQVHKVLASLEESLPRLKEGILERCEEVIR